MLNTENTGIYVRKNAWCSRSREWSEMEMSVWNRGVQGDTGWIVPSLKMYIAL